VALRDTSTRDAPRLANSMALARPMPLEAPVTSTTSVRPEEETDSAGVSAVTSSRYPGSGPDTRVGHNGIHR
jgi:hypothetical protein